MMAKSNKEISLSDASVVPVLKEKLLGLVKLIVDDDDDDFTIETTDADEAIATLSLLKNYFKQKKNHRSSQPQPSLPTELITDILLKLPVKPLLRLRCICKQWNSIISDTQFSKLHLSTSNHHRVLLYNERAWPPLSLSCSVESLFNDPLTPNEHLISKKFDLIVGTCNGLLCLFTIKNFVDTRVRLWNPSTRLASRASPPMFYYNDDVIYYGFGYDCVSGKYKVLLSFYDYINNGLVTKVYAFGDNCWRTPTQNFNYLGDNSGNKLGSFVSGNLHWVVPDYNGTNIIYSFDLEKEIFGQVSLPDDNLINPMQATLKNCLCVYGHNSTHFVVWIMKDYGVKESWTKLIVIPNLKLKVWHDYYTNVKPLCVSDRSQIMLNCDAVMLLYNPKDVCLKYPNIHRNMEWFSQQHIYIESLVSPCF